MEAFNKAKTIIINTKKSEDSCYWDLYLSNSPVRKIKADKAACNHHETDLDQSLELLQTAMYAYADCGMKYFIIVLKTNKNSPQGFNIPVLNDHYVSYSPGISGLNSMNSFQQTQNAQLLNLQQKMHEMQLEHIREINKIEMERLREDFEGALNHKDKAIDKILEFFQKPAFQPVIAGLLGRITGAGHPTPVIANTEAPATIENVANNNSDQNNDQVQMHQAQKIMAESIQKIENVFPGKTLSIMQQISSYIETNPEQAQMLLNSLNVPNNG